MKSKKFCSSDCQQKCQRGKADKERRVAWHLFRYMQRNSPVALAKLMKMMSEERERNVRPRGKPKGTGVASGGTGIARPAGAVEHVRRRDQG
jgi:hypothetical protein